MEQIEDYEKLAARIGEAGAYTKYPLDLPEPTFKAEDGTASHDVACMLRHILYSSRSKLTHAVWEFSHEEMPKFLDSFSEVRVKSLDEMIKWNEEHKSFAMPERK
jgi:hypothetical protein